jgi:hypothetical protein
MMMFLGYAMAAVFVCFNVSIVTVVALYGDDIEALKQRKGGE